MNYLKINNINSFLIYQIGRFGTSVLINIILAKNYLSLSELSRFESFTFYASAISFFWITGISQGFLSMFKDNNILNKKNSITFDTLFLFLSISLISAIILIFSTILLPKDFIPGLSSSDIYLLSAYMIVYPTGFIIEYVFLVNNKYRNLVVYAFISSIFTILMVPFPSYFGLSIEYCLYGLFIISTIKFIYLIILLKKISHFNFNKNKCIDLLKISLPLIGSALVAGSASYIDGFIVSQKFDPSTFVIFRYGAKEFPIFLMISSAFGTSMIPLISNHNQMKENLSLIKNKSSLYIRYFFPLAILLLLISQYIFQYVFNKSFYESYKVFDIYLLLIISRFIFPGTILIGLKKNSIILLVSILELIINISASLLFIRFFGYLGVAYGTLLAYFFEKAILMVFVKKEFKISIYRYLPIGELTAFSFALIITYILKQILL